MGILMKSMVHVQAIHVQGHIIVTGLLEINENAENRTCQNGQFFI